MTWTAGLLPNTRAQRACKEARQFNLGSKDVARVLLTVERASGIDAIQI